MWEYILIPAILGALIGWVTNILAVKLIFRPYQSISVLGLFTLQGLLPKRKAQLASAIGQTVEQELLSSEEIFKHLQDPTLQKTLSQGIMVSISARVEKYLPGFLPGIKEGVMGIIDKVVQGEVERYFKETFPKSCDQLKDSLPISKMVEEKINQLDIKELERLVINIANRELKHIEVMGGLLGLIIGLLQGMVFLLLLT